MLSNLRKVLKQYLEEYEINKGMSPDYYSDIPIIHPMATAKYILTLCSLYRSNLLSYTNIVKKTKEPLKQLYSTKNIHNINKHFFWGLNFSWRGLNKNESYLITTSLVVQSLLELKEIITNDNFLNQFGDNALSSLEYWIKEEVVFCNELNMLVPKYSDNIEEAVFNTASYANAIVSKYTSNDILKEQSSNYLDLIWKIRIKNVGWKYSYDNNIIDLLHNCYIQNALIYTENFDINESINMINQFNFLNKFTDAFIIKKSYDNWTGGQRKIIENYTYLECKEKDARLWSVGELLVLLSHINKSNNKTINSFSRKILKNILDTIYYENKYFRHTMHFTHGLALFLETERKR